jgi:hypothetical protein
LSLTFFARRRITGRGKEGYTPPHATVDNPVFSSLGKKNGFFLKSSSSPNPIPTSSWGRVNFLGLAFARIASRSRRTSAFGVVRWIAALAGIAMVHID